MTHKLFYAGEPGDGFGWGVCNRYLRQELSKLVELVDEPSPEAVCFMPLDSGTLRASSDARGWKNIGYTFNEFPLAPEAIDNAKRYDLIFCGSTWCKDRLADAGIKNTTVLVQGVDHEIFKPGPPRPPDGQFWIFSGGKFEYRKGQDLVLAAFKELLTTHPRVRLITAWENLWPGLCDTMAESKHIKYELRGATWGEKLGHLCDINGIPKERVLTLSGIVPNKEMAAIYRQCDLGLFPNRCEGGTNLVMMEFMACGRAVVATMNTGHMDVLEPIANSVSLLAHKADDRKWAVPDVDILIGQVDMAIRHCAPQAGHRAADIMKQWTWERAARTLVENL
jgi:glycosyltransferase involved in cell wall biosynthesis